MILLYMETRTSLIAQRVKNLPAIQETQEMRVQSLGREDFLEEGNGNPLQYSCLENPMDQWSQRVEFDRVTTHAYGDITI